MTPVRIEMPFTVNCLGSAQHPPHQIAKGTRVTANNFTCGQYLSSNIQLLSFSCSVCGNSIQLRTNPKNAGYDIVSGAKPLANSVCNRSLSTDSPFQKLEEHMVVKQRLETDQNAIRSLLDLMEQRTDILDCNQRIEAFLHQRTSFQMMKNQSK
ncbi:hypothetical protein P9112_002955 [Eukaryota sp. TZLM1-RC]